MRFFANGPDIPEQLIASRNEGRVVFFCGAGVSVPSKLPSFLKLTQQVMQKLGVPLKSNSITTIYRKEVEYVLSGESPKDYKLPFSLDQVFYLLQQEYGVEVVEKEVNTLLKINKSTPAEKHKIVLRLAKNPNQQPQIVTTNFDLLFEKADRSVKTHIPPSLPDLSCGQPLEGVVYLHGRWSKRPYPAGSEHSLIISSADFGRAYLADGWASRFIKELANQYVIVLLGYSAEDPPVRYLLEGLHTKNGNADATIYAFDRGSQEQTDQNWRHRGVIGVAFPEYEDLWDSLSAWADFADSPSTWYTSTLALAQQKPEQLQAFQRRQVAYLISSDHGAKLFAESTPLPCAEWLCVFDPYLRNAKPEIIRNYQDEVEDYEYIPRRYYGLDDDPLVEYDNDPDKLYLGVNFLSALPKDRTDYVEPGLAQPYMSVASQPARLRYLGAWFCKLLHDPITLWWAAGKTRLHPQFVMAIEHQLNSYAPTIPEAIGHKWRLLLEYLNQQLSCRDDFRWYDFKEKNKAIGWNGYAFRQLEKVLQPFLTVKRAHRYMVRPPGKIEQITALYEVIEIAVEFPELHQEKLEIPDQHLVRVFDIWWRALEKAVQLVDELPYFDAPDLWAGERDSFLHDAAYYMKCCIMLFDQLAASQPEEARRAVMHWPEKDPYFFDQLKVYAWRHPGLFDSSDIASGLLLLSEESFWGSRCRPELLKLLMEHWENLSSMLREQLVDRVLAGPSRALWSDDSAYQRYVFYAATPMLGWLDRQGCTLPTSAQIYLQQLRQHNDWHPDLEIQAIERWQGQSGWVHTDKNPGVLLDAPVHQIIEIVKETSRSDYSELIDYRPFNGLVKQRPLKALRALVLDAKQGRYPIELWRTILADWPTDQPLRLKLQLSRRLLKLPVAEIAKIAHPFSQWMHNELPALGRATPDCAMEIWDSAVNLLFATGEEALESSIIESRISGRRVVMSRRTREHAINAPVGYMARLLIDMFWPKGRKKGQGLPSHFSKRIYQLLQAPGVGKDHAVNIFGIEINGLFWHDPEWVRNELLPLFNLQSRFSEPAWNGFLHGDKALSPELFAELRPHFINLFQAIKGWQWRNDLSRRLHQHLVLACRSGLKDQRYLSFEETREILQQTDDVGRVETLWFLTSLITSKSSWQQFGKRFLNEAWPRELRFRSESTTKKLILLAGKMDQNFPEAVNVVLPFLIPVRYVDIHIYSLRKKSDASLGSRFPEAMLVLLDAILDENSHPPYQFDELLGQLADSRPKLTKDKRWLRLSKLSNRNY